MEAVPLVKVNDQAIIDFLYGEIFTRFGEPKEIITNGGPQFVSHKLESLLHNYHIQHRITSPYHPQANGQVESTNKVIASVLTKRVRSHCRDWTDRPLEALWAYCTTWCNTTGFSTYDLVYGKNDVFLIEFENRTLKTDMEANLYLTEAQRNRLNQLNELDEKCTTVVHQT